jgi:hypothetical protein
MDFGPGVVTAILGLLLLAAGAYDLLRIDRVFSPRVSMGVAGAILATVVIFLIWFYAIDDWITVGPPYLGTYITGVGGLVALFASFRLWRLRRAST